MAKLLLAGCGDLGLGLAQLLSTSDAWDIWALRRDVSSLREGPRFHPWAGDLLQLGPLPARFTHVVFTATPGRYEADAYEAVYVEALERLLAALEGCPIERVVLASSTSVFPHDDGRWVDEDTPAQPLHFAGQAIRRGEQLLEGSGLPHSIVRFGGIYGPTRSMSLLRRVQSRQSQRSPQPRYTNRIHRDDCVGVLAHLLQHPQPAPLYLGVDHAPVLRNELLDWLCECLQMPPLPTATSNPPRSRPATHKRCSNQRLRDSGYDFLYPSYREGYGEMLKLFEK